jgi:uncharacterized BrkB/YihY/UPF0761 family membrane protein
LLLWMWISNVAILLGAEFNAELESQAATSFCPGRSECHPRQGRYARRLATARTGDRGPRRFGFR